MSTHRPTLHDVAAAAEVSIATVSRVINGLEGRSRITVATADRVRAAVAQLGYTPNLRARDLRLGRVNALGVLAWRHAVLTAWHPWHVRILGGFEQAVRADGHDMILLGSEQDGEARIQPAVRALEERSIAGLLIMSNIPEDELAQLRGNGGQSLVAVSVTPVSGVPTVVPDLAPGLEAALVHLARLGHRTVGFADFDRTGDSRFALVGRLAAEQGITLESVHLGLHPTSMERDGAAYLEVAAQALRPRLAGLRATAVIAGNDVIAHAVVGLWREAGLAVPRDRSLIGIDDLQAEICYPPLTSISQELIPMGRLAGRVLLDAVRGTPPTEAVMPIASTLVVRQSTAAPA